MSERCKQTCRHTNHDARDDYYHYDNNTNSDINIDSNSNSNSNIDIDTVTFNRSLLEYLLHHEKGRSTHRPLLMTLVPLLFALAVVALVALSNVEAGISSDNNGDRRGDTVPVSVIGCTSSSSCDLGEDETVARWGSHRLSFDALESTSDAEELRIGRSNQWVSKMDERAIMTLQQTSIDSMVDTSSRADSLIEKWRRKSPKDYTVQDVLVWLSVVGLDQYAAFFNRRNMNGRKLLLLQEAIASNTMDLDAHHDTSRPENAGYLHHIQRAHLDIITRDLGIDWPLDKQLFLEELANLRRKMVTMSRTRNGAKPERERTDSSVPLSSTDGTAVTDPLHSLSSRSHRDPETMNKYSRFHQTSNFDFWRIYDSNKRYVVQSILNGIVGVPRLAIFYLYYAEREMLFMIIGQGYTTFLFWISVLICPQLAVLYYMLPFLQDNIILGSILAITQVFQFCREVAKFHRSLTKRNLVFLDFTLWQMFCHLTFVVLSRFILPGMLLKVCLWLYHMWNSALISIIVSLCTALHMQIYLYGMLVYWIYKSGRLFLVLFIIALDLLVRGD